MFKIKGTKSQGSCYCNKCKLVKKEDENYFKEFNLKSRNYLEILKTKKNINNNIKDWLNSNNDTIELSNELGELDLDNNNYNTNKGRWLKWINNSCRFDSIMTSYLFIFYSKNETNFNLSTNSGLKPLHKTIKALLNNVNSDDRYNFWSYVNYNQLDRGFLPLSLGEIGYITGIFKIFDDNFNYCIKIKKTIFCFSCQKKTENLFYSKCLLNINQQDLNCNELSKIINSKFLPTI